MHPKQLRYLSRNPRALMQHRMTGRLPRVIRPMSPLISLLEQIPARERLHWRGIKLGPDLGYYCGHQFHNAQQLLTWLKPSEQMLEGVEPWPAESFRDKRFAKRLTLDDLKGHCAQYPRKQGEANERGR